MIPIGETHDGRADMTNFEMDLFDTRMHHPSKIEKKEHTCCGRATSRQIVKPACLPISVLALLIIGLVFLPLFKDEDLEAPDKLSLVSVCSSPCSISLVESIPTGLALPPPQFRSTADTWISIINSTQYFLDIAAFYWNLNSSEYITADKGRAVFHALVAAGKRGVKIRIAQDVSKGLSNNSDSAWLALNKLAKVRTINFSSLLGGGVLHTKFMISDMKRVYIGSANMDWKSLTEVKEMGVFVDSCACLAGDFYRIFAVYWRLADPGAVIPSKWPISYRTQYNFAKPMPIDIRVGEKTEHVSLFISSSPLPFNPLGRENDIDAIVKVIRQANSSVCVSVMDYLPQTIYKKPERFWPLIDDSLRDAAFRGVGVRLLISSWNHTRAATVPFLRSLLAINAGLPGGGQKGVISVKLFEVPSSSEQAKIDFARVNHAKYLVADSTAYIGTSNWAGDYFIDTAGVGLAAKSLLLSGQLQKVFDRDWNSPYARPVKL